MLAWILKKQIIIYNVSYYEKSTTAYSSCRLCGGM
jgi:hypothetical protein